MTWRDALLRLHLRGWNADDIDEACEAVHEACDDGAYDGIDVADLTLDQVQSVLVVPLDRALLESVRIIAILRRQRDPDGDALQRALYDLDAFAYDYAGDS